MADNNTNMACARFVNAFCVLWCEKEPYPDKNDATVKQLLESHAWLWKNGDACLVSGMMSSMPPWLREMMPFTDDEYKLKIQKETEDRKKLEEKIRFKKNESF